MATKKTPQQRLAELEEQQRKLEDELKQKRARIVRAKRRENAKLTNEKRKRDTRRKVLIGAAVLAKMEAGQMTNEQLTRLLNGYLTRPDDRALFDLPESGPGEQANQPAPEPTAGHG